MIFHRSTFFLSSFVLTLCMSVEPVIAAATANDTTVIGLQVDSSISNLPKGLSDHTANIDPETKLVYIAGGCDALNGNVYLNNAFQCLDISDDFFSYDISTKTFTNLTRMPMERYRHATVLINQHLWVLGGRDKDDFIPTTVDVYNIDSNTWMMFNISEKYQISDHGAFPNEATGHAYFCGGYTGNYTSSSMCFSIDTEATLASTNNTVVIVERSSLMIPRGDISVVAISDGAIVTGGFSDANDWCAPYGETEQYSFATDTWVTKGTMNSPRGDMALVYLDGVVYALGGERELPNICELIRSEDLPGADQERLTVDDIEVYKLDSGLWTVLEDLPDNRFRFAAVPLQDDERTIVAFGGQTSYNASCNCQDTILEVTYYKEMYGAAVTNDSTSNVDNDADKNANSVAPRSLSSISILYSYTIICISCTLAAMFY